MSEQLAPPPPKTLEGSSKALVGEQAKIISQNSRPKDREQAKKLADSVKEVISKDLISDQLAKKVLYQAKETLGKKDQQTEKARLFLTYVLLKETIDSIKRLESKQRDFELAVDEEAEISSIALNIQAAKLLGLTDQIPEIGEGFKGLTSDLGINPDIDLLSAQGRSRRGFLRAAAVGTTMLIGARTLDGISPPVKASVTSPDASVNTPEPLSSPEAKVREKGLIKDILGPALLEYVQKHRENDLKNERFIGIDWALNKNRINLVFLGLGVETEEFTDSVIVLSYSLTDNSLVIINIPRDVHAPEVDRLRSKLGIPNPEFNAINTAYLNGKKEPGDGYDLVREVIADATSLSPDLITKSRIQGFVGLIAEALGTVEIEISEAIDTTKAGPKYTNFRYEKGKQVMTAKELQEYARSRVTTSEVDRNKRQQEVVIALIQNLQKRWNEGDLIQKFRLLNNLREGIERQQSSGNIQFDFDINQVITGQLMNITKNLSTATVSGKQINFDKPQIITTVLDQKFGLVPEKRAAQVRPHLVTIQGGNYKASDLREGYWKRFRQAIYERLKK